MDMGLRGKLALVTGSTKGIGKAIAVELAREGADVIINGRQEADVKRVTEMLAAQFPATTPVGAAYDLSIAEERQKLFFVQPTVDILINNMGIFEPMDYFDIDDATWERFFNVNVMAGNDLARFYLKRCSRRTLGASSTSRVRRR